MYILISMRVNVRFFFNNTVIFIKLNDILSHKFQRKMFRKHNPEIHRSKCFQRTNCQLFLTLKASKTNFAR